MGQLISFQEAIEKRAPRRKQKAVESAYCCYVTRERLEGYCELLICEKNMKRAEWFCLSFSTDGLMRHMVMQADKIQKWRQETNHLNISYLQAIRLLGDSVRQTYKYQTVTDWIPETKSIHLQRIWQEEFYNDRNDEVEWRLPQQEFKEMLWTYFRALGNKDATLVYDMSAEPVQGAEPRSIYAHHWNHELEDLLVLNYDVDPMSVCRNGENDYTLFVTVQGNYQTNQILEVDMRLRVVEQKDGFRILQDQVLEPRTIFHPLR